MKLIKSYRIFFLSFFLAAFLWLYVKLSARYQKVIAIPVHVVNVKEGFAVVSEMPDQVSVLFEADGKTLLGLEFFYDVKYVLDLATYKENSKFDVSENLPSIKLPPKVPAKVIAITSQDTFYIRTEKLIRKTVPIRADIDASCGAGYVMVGGFRLHPDTVTVTCPASFSDSVTFLSTDNLSFDDLEADKEIKVKLASAVNKNIQFRRTEVSVFMDVQPLGETELNNLPVRLINAPSNLNLIVQPSTFSIKIRGGVDFLATLSRDSIQGIIDYSLEQSLHHPQPRLTIVTPRDISWSQITPNRFNLVKLDADDSR